MSGVKRESKLGVPLQPKEFRDKFDIVDYHEDGSPIYAMANGVEKAFVESVLAKKDKLLESDVPVEHFEHLI